jgi:thioredoxin 1
LTQKNKPDKAFRTLGCQKPVDEEPGLAQQFGVMSIPTLILFRDGKAADTMVGFHPLEELEKIIAK